MKKLPQKNETHSLEVTMPNPNRAQIFQSFDALKGFRELLEEQEKVIVPPRILSEDQRDELDWKLHQIQIGSMIRIIYREGSTYIQLEGIVSKLNMETRIIQIVKKKIDLLCIVEIEILSN